MADTPEVTEAKAAHKKVFDAYTAGEIPLPVAPVHEVKPVCKLFFSFITEKKIHLNQKMSDSFSLVFQSPEFDSL